MMQMIAMNGSDHEHMRGPLEAPGDDPEALREMLRALAGATGYAPDALVEWCSADAPDTPANMPPLYYAALRPCDPLSDMPLGLGESTGAALTDLLWMLGGPALVSDLRTEGAARREVGAVCEMPAGEEH
jgi:hypothetical protein